MIEIVIYYIMFVSMKRQFDYQEVDVVVDVVNESQIIINCKSKLVIVNSSLFIVCGV